MRTVNHKDQVDAMSGFETLESRRLFSGATATQDAAASAAADTQIRIDMPLVHAGSAAHSTAYRAAADTGDSTLIVTRRWTAIITAIGGEVSVSAFGVAPVVYVASRGNPFVDYDYSRPPRGHASSPVPPAANQNGPVTPVVDAGGSTSSAEKSPASAGNGASAPVAVAEAGRAQAGGDAISTRAAAGAANVAVAALAASTGAASRSHVTLSASAGREASLNDASLQLPDQHGNFVGSPAAAPALGAVAEAARASFSSSLIGINSFLPATPVVPADGVRARLPAEDLAAAEQASLARAAGKSLPDRLYYFARIDPMRTFADAMAAFANESAHAPESQQAGSAWAWGVTAVVGLADAAVLAWWHASRRKEAKRRESRQIARHYYGPGSAVRRRVAPAN